jgi:hypothetical protein
MSTAASPAGALPGAGAATAASTGAGLAAREAATVVTRVEFDAPPARVWEALMFYEQVEERPPLLLRLLLPVPVRTEGRKSEVGDEARCIYEGGHLVKRVTKVERGRHYGFDVVVQALAVGGGLSLRGGWYALREAPGGRTEVETGTRYVGARRPRWLFRPLEALVCHAFHRHILGAMRRAVGRAG